MSLKGGFWLCYGTKNVLRKKFYSAPGPHITRIAYHITTLKTVRNLQSTRKLSLDVAPTKSSMNFRQTVPSLQFTLFGSAFQARSTLLAAADLLFSVIYRVSRDCEL